MLYKKPKDVRYVDMAIFVDRYSNEKLEDISMETQNKIYEYLYHLVYMLERKSNYFQRPEYIDSFAITLATDVFFRIFSKKRFELKEDGTPKSVCIKSCLNYIKSIIGLRRIAFEQSNYAQTFTYSDSDEESSEYGSSSGYTFADMLSDSTRDLDNIEFVCSLESIHLGVRDFLKSIPYRYGTEIWNNIYLSCLLTFLNTITLSRSDMAKIDSGRKSANREEMLSNESLETSAILYHLDDSMNDYIVLLVREIKHFLASELSYRSDCQITTRDLVHLAVSDINSDRYSSELGDFE